MKQLLDFNNKNFVIFLIIINAIIHFSFNFILDINSVNFYSFNIQVILFFILFNIFIFMFVNLIFRKNNVLINVLISGTLYTVFYSLGFVDQINSDYLNSIITSLFPYLWIKVSILGNGAWIYFSIVLAFLILIVNQIKKKILNKKNDKKENFIINGIIIYLGLTVFVWFVTHFAFLGSHFVYMNNNKLVVLNIIDNKEYDLYKNYNILKFDNYNKMKEYYYDEIIKNLYKNATENQKENIKNRKNDILTKSFIDYEFFEKNKNFEEIYRVKNYNDIKNFWDWIFFSFNTNMKDSYNDIYYNSFLYSPYCNNCSVDTFSHFHFIIKKENNNYISYITFDNNFKKELINDKYNFINILFHIIYIILFIFIYRIHLKRGVFK